MPDRVPLDAAAQGAVIATVEPSVRREVGLIVRDGAPSAVLEAFLTHATTYHRSAG